MLIDEFSPSYWGIEKSQVSVQSGGPEEGFDSPTTVILLLELEEGEGSILAKF